MARRWRLDGGDHETGSMRVGRRPGGMVVWMRRGWTAYAWAGKEEWERRYKNDSSLELAKRAVERWLDRRQRGKVPSAGRARRVG